METKKKTDYALPIIILLLVGLGLCYWVFSSGSKSAYVVPTSKPTTHIVVYEVDGSAYGMDVTLQNDTGGTDQKGALGLPYKKTWYNFKSGDFVYISAQNDSQFGDLRCTITIDGVALYKAEARGAYSIATCSGSVQ